MSSERKPPDDSELDDFLAGRHPVGRAYREASGQETAPRELDDAILRMAREHVATPVRRRPRWLQPLAVAATLALSLGVLMNIWREPALREQAVPTTTEEIEVPSEAPSPSDASAGQGAAMPEPVEEQKPEALPPMTEGDAFKKFSPPPERAPAPARPEPPKPAPEPRRAAQPFPRDAAPEPAEREERASPLSDPVSPSAIPPRADSTVAPTAPPPPALDAAAPAPPAAASGAVQSAHEERQQEQKQQEERRQDAERALAKEKATVQRSMAADDAAADRGREIAPSREALIERARAALARGDADEARRQVAELRRLYPDAALPDDLRALAEPLP